MASGQFAIDVRRFCEKAGDNADLAFRKIVLDMFSRVVMRSPVGNPELWKNPAPKGYVGGRFRNNWYVSIGAPSGETNDTPDASGMGSINRVQGVLLGLKMGMTIFLTNNSAYAWPLETGWSTQAPAGFVGITVTEFSSLVDRAAGETNRP